MTSSDREGDRCRGRVADAADAHDHESETTIQSGSGRRRREAGHEQRADARSRRTSAPPAARTRTPSRGARGSEIGRSSTFHSPNDEEHERADEEQRAQDRRAEQRREPDSQVGDDDRDATRPPRGPASRSAPSARCSSAATTNDAASMTNAQLAGRRAREEAGTGEPDGGRAERGDRQERVRRRELLVARELGDDAVVGRIEELLDAGVDEQQQVTGPASAIASMPRTTAMSPTTTAWIRQVAIMIRLRSCRSTYTPASSPTMRLGIGRDHQREPDRERRFGLAVDEDRRPRDRSATIRRSRSAGPARAARSPASRKTANIDGAAGAAAAVIGPPAAPSRRRRSSIPEPGPPPERPVARV